MLKKTFVHCKDFGREYFDGNLAEIIKIIDMLTLEELQSTK